MQIKLYLAGKVTGKDKNWREKFCAEISKRTSFEVLNLDPAKSMGDFLLNESDPNLVFGRDAYMISQSDAVVVNLTDDISVGGSQEMIIAKYYKKPLIGFAKAGGKFRQDNVEISGKQYFDWTHPFVAVPCDFLVGDFEELAQAVHLALKPHASRKDISVIDAAVDYYFKNFSLADEMLRQVGLGRPTGTKKIFGAVKALIVKDAKFLIIKQQIQNRTMWDLPGGIVRFGETPEAALRRESLEEVGLDLEITDQAGMWSFYRDDGNQVLCTTFVCKPKTFNVDIDHNPESAYEKIIDYAWVDKAQFLRSEFGVYDRSLKRLVQETV